MSEGFGASSSMAGVGWSAPTILAALSAATVTAHHAKSEPHEGPEHRGGYGEEPKRPSEAPGQEVELHALGVLDHENEQQSYSCERGDRSTAESASLRLRARAST